MARTIGTFAVKGGVGKTTTAVNLSCALVKWFEKDVLLIDTNVSSAHIGLHFNVYEESLVTIRDVLADPRLAEQLHTYKIQHGGYTRGGVDILPCPLRNRSDDYIPVDSLRAVINQLEHHYDYIILDTAPGAENAMVNAAGAVDEGIVVATPDIPTITDGLKTVELLEEVNAQVMGVAMNRVRGESFEADESEVANTCRHNVVAALPEDTKVQQAVTEGAPVTVLYGRSDFSKRMKELASYVAGEPPIQVGLWERVKSFFSSPVQTGPVEEPDLEEQVEHELEAERFPETKSGIVEGVKRQLPADDRHD